jgi:hypothetical protein
VQVPYRTGDRGLVSAAEGVINTKTNIRAARVDAKGRPNIKPQYNQYMKPIRPRYQAYLCLASKPMQTIALGMMTSPPGPPGPR